MELRVLHYFLTIAREGSLIGAAKALNLTQPTLSRQMKELEDKLGQKLLIRSAQGMLLTSEGLILRKRAEEIMELVEKTKGVISLGAKMGEGWLLTAEMIELVQGGYGNIVCAQPFGCLPNHIVGKGMVNKIRALYPSANITPIDYDPSATRVNQENRIKLMLAVAKERLNAPAEAQPLTAEQLAGGAPQVGATV